MNHNLDDREILITLFETYGNLLAVSQKQVFHLHYIEDLSLGEIASITATTRQAVNDALKKARIKLLAIQTKMGN